MRTLRKVARARPTRERKTVQKGYEFEVEAKVISHDIPRKSAKRPSKSTSPPCYVPDQSDSDYGDYSEDSGDTDPLQAAAFASGKRHPAYFVSFTKKPKLTEPLYIEVSRETRESRSFMSSGQPRKHSTGSVKSTIDDSQVEIQTANMPKHSQESQQEDLAEPIIVVFEDNNDSDYVPPRTRKRTASPDVVISTKNPSKRAKSQAIQEGVHQSPHSLRSSKRSSGKKEDAAKHFYDTHPPLGERDQTAKSPASRECHNSILSNAKKQQISAPSNQDDPPVMIKKSPGNGDSGYIALHMLPSPAHIHHLLPSPRFPHFQWLYGKVWTDADEQMFELERRKSPAILSCDYIEVQFETEMKLWKAMIRLFDCLPHALFRYGLRVDDTTYTAQDPDFWLKVKRGMPKDLAEELLTLLPHPIWDGRIELLRYALQLSVSHRVKQHVRPLGRAVDIIDIGVDIYNAIEMLRDDKDDSEADTMLGDYHYEILMRAGVGSDKDVKALDKSLQASIEQEEAACPEERLLFLLRASDVKAVQNALDRMYHLGAPKWRPCIDYYAQYEKNGGAAGAKDAENMSCKTFMAWRVHCCMAEEREKAIRAKLRNNNAPDLLLDMRESDPIPWYFLSRRMSEQQKQVLSGVVYPPWEKALPVAQGLSTTNG